MHVDMFLKNLETLLSNHTTADVCLLVGDINLNILNTADNKICSYLNIVICYGYINIIYKPTTVVDKSSSNCYEMQG